MNLIEVKALALQLEVNLEVDGKSEKIIATPKENVTDDLRAGVKENRDELMRDLLISRALEYVIGEMEEKDLPRGLNESIPYEDLEGATFKDFGIALRRWASRMVGGMRERPFRTEAEIFKACRQERDKRGWKEIA